MISARRIISSMSPLTALSKLGCASQLFFKPRIARIEDLDETSKQLMDILHCGHIISLGHPDPFLTVMKDDITNALFKSQHERIELLKILVVLKVFYLITPKLWNEIQKQVSTAVTIAEKRKILSTSINIAADECSTLFEVAVNHLGNYDFSTVLIKTLLEMKANPNSLQDGRSVMPVLQNCLDYLQCDNLELLLQAGASIDTRCIFERTPLIQLCQTLYRADASYIEKNANIFRQLLKKLFEYSPNPFLKDFCRYTALDYLKSGREILSEKNLISTLKEYDNFISMLEKYEIEYKKRKVATTTAEYTLDNLGPIISAYAEGERDGSIIRRRPN